MSGYPTAEARASDTFLGMLCGGRDHIICRYDSLEEAKGLNGIY